MLRKNINNAVAGNFSGSGMHAYDYRKGVRSCLA